MKKIFILILSIFTLITFISCTDKNVSATAKESITNEDIETEKQKQIDSTTKALIEKFEMFIDNLIKADKIDKDTKLIKNDDGTYILELEEVINPTNKDSLACTIKTNISINKYGSLKFSSDIDFDGIKEFYKEKTPPNDILELNNSLFSDAILYFSDYEIQSDSLASDLNAIINSSLSVTYDADIDFTIVENLLLVTDSFKLNAGNGTESQILVTLDYQIK